ncbi:MAG TPA: VOC family protein [Dokdonella sp.]
MLDHIGFVVSAFARSTAFDEHAHAPLGVGLGVDASAERTGAASHAGFGEAGRPYFRIGDDANVLHGRLHVGFAAGSRGDVDAVHRAAIATGARDDGAPRLRPQDHARCYAAFVLDPDGHDVEAARHSAAS